MVAAAIRRRPVHWGGQHLAPRPISASRYAMPAHTTMIVTPRHHVLRVSLGSTPRAAWQARSVCAPHASTAPPISTPIRRPNASTVSRDSTRRLGTSALVRAVHRVCLPRHRVVAMCRRVRSVSRVSIRRLVRHGASSARRGQRTRTRIRRLSVRTVRLGRTRAAARRSAVFAVPVKSTATATRRRRVPDALRVSTGRRVTPGASVTALNALLGAPTMTLPASLHARTAASGHTRWQAQRTAASVRMRVVWMRI